MILQLNTPLSSTSKNRQFNTKNLQFNTPLTSTPKNRQFNTKNPAIQHTPHFTTPFSSTHPSVQHQKSVCWIEGCLVLNWSFCSWTEGCVELKGVVNSEVCWIEAFLVLNWRFFGVELRSVLNWRVFGVELTDFGGWKGVILVLNWYVELRGSMWNWGVTNKLLPIFEITSQKCLRIFC